MGKICPLGKVPLGQALVHILDCCAFCCAGQRPLLPCSFSASISGVSPGSGCLLGYREMMVPVPTLTGATFIFAGNFLSTFNGFGSSGAGRGEHYCSNRVLVGVNLFNDLQPAAFVDNFILVLIANLERKIGFCIQGKSRIHTNMPFFQFCNGDFYYNSFNLTRCRWGCLKQSVSCCYAYRNFIR